MTKDRNESSDATAVAETDRQKGNELELRQMGGSECDMFNTLIAAQAQV